MFYVRDVGKSYLASGLAAGISVGPISHCQHEFPCEKCRWCWTDQCQVLTRLGYRDGSPPRRPGAPGPQSEDTASSTNTYRATGRSIEGRGKGEGGVGSHRCVVEGGGVVVLMPSAQVVVMSDTWEMPEGKPGVRKTRSSSECEPGLIQVEQSRP